MGPERPALPARPGGPAKPGGPGGPMGPGSPLPPGRGENKTFRVKFSVKMLTVQTWKVHSLHFTHTISFTC